MSDNFDKGTWWSEIKSLKAQVLHLEQERDQLKEKLEIATGALNHYLYGGSDYSKIARDALNLIDDNGD